MTTLLFIDPNILPTPLLIYEAPSWASAHSTYGTMPPSIHRTWPREEYVAVSCAWEKFVRTARVADSTPALMSAHRNNPSPHSNFFFYGMFVKYIFHEKSNLFSSISENFVFNMFGNYLC